MKTNKTLSNVLYNVFYQVSVIMIPLITTPYVSRVLGSYQTGLYSYTHTMAMWFAVIARFGFGNYGNRQVATIKDDKQQLDRTFSALLKLQIITGSVALVSYLVYMLFLCKENHFLAWLSGFYVLGAAIDISWFFYGMEEFKYITIKTLSVRIISTICVFIFVKSQDDTWKYVLILALVSFINALLLWLNLNNKVKIVKTSFSETAIHIKGCFILFIPVILIDIYRLMDKAMLGYINAIDEIGYYTYADRIAELPYTVIAAVGTVMLPRMTNMVARGEKSKSFKLIQNTFEINTIVGSAIMFGLIAVSDQFVLLFLGPNYSRTGLLLRIVAPMIIVRAWANVIRTQYLMPNRMDGAYLTSLVFGVVTNLILNLLFIPKHGAAGAAIATLCAESLVAMVQIWFGRKQLPILHYILDNLIYVFFGFVMMIVVQNYTFPEFIPILSLGLRVLIGAMVYIPLCGIIVIIKLKYKKNRSEY